MPAANEQAQADAFRQFVATDPEAQALMARWRSGGYPGQTPGAGGRAGRPDWVALNRDLDRLAEARGVPRPKDWTYSPQTGEIRKLNWWERNADWVIPASIVGGGVTAAALTGGSPAAGAAGGSGGGGGAVGPTAGGITSAGMRAAMPGSMEDAPPSPQTDGGGSTLGDIIRRIAQIGAPLGALGISRALRPDGSGSAGDPSAISPELQQLLAMSMRRMAAQEPLFEAVNRQAFAGLPEYVKKGGQ